jgi:hypothetical protein
MGRTIVATCLLWVAGVVACNRDCPACDATPAASTVGAAAAPTAPTAPTTPHEAFSELNAQLRAIDTDYDKELRSLKAREAQRAIDMRDACDDIRITHGKGGPLAGEPIDALNQKLCAPYWGQ